MDALYMPFYLRSSALQSGPDSCLPAITLIPYLWSSPLYGGHYRLGILIWSSPYSEPAVY